MARLYFLRLCLVSPGLALLLCTCCARLGVATSGGPAALVPPSRAAYELAAAALSFPTARVSRQAERAALADMPGLPVGQEGQREAPAACTSLSGPRCLAAGGSTWAHRDAGGADDANGEQGVGEHVFKVYSTGGSTGDKVNVLTMDTRTAAGRTAAAAGLLGLLAAGADREELEHVREVRDAATLDRGLEDVFTGKAVHGKGKASGLNPAAVLVAFYHPQCLHCVHMLEQLDGVAKTLREQHGVKTFAVDCAELGDACARAGVVEMPDLRLYYRPKDDETCAEGAQPEEDAEEGATRTPPFVRYYTPDFDERDALEEKWLELCRKLVNHLALQENLHEMAAMKGFGNVGWTSDDILAFARRVIVAAGVAEIPFLRRPKGGGSAQMTLAQLRQAQAEGEAKATAKPTKVEYCRLGELDAHERVVSGAWRSALEADGAVAEATGAVSKGRRQGKGSGTPYQGRLDLSTAASAIGGSPQEIVVINWRSAPCRILWIDFQGKEKFYFTLLPGQTRQSTSFVGHVWVARDPASGEVLEAWTIEDKTEGEAEEVQLLAIYPADDEEPVS